MTGGTGCWRAVGTLAARSPPPSSSSFLEAQPGSIPPGALPGASTPVRYLGRAPQEGKAGSISFLWGPIWGGQWEALASGRGRGTGEMLWESSPPPSPSRLLPGLPPPPGKPRKLERPREPGFRLQGHESAGSCPDLTPEHAIEGGPLRCHWGEAALGMGGFGGGLWG